MTIIDIQIIKFIQLIDVAIVNTEELKMTQNNSLTIESINETIDNLKAFRRMAATGDIPRPSRGDTPQGTGLGLTRGIGEWTEDDRLLDAAYAVEKHYKEHM